MAASVDEAERLTDEILGMQLVTPQTGADGQRVKRVLIEEALDIDTELYIGITLDRATGHPVIMASRAGDLTDAPFPEGTKSLKH